MDTLILPIVLGLLGFGALLIVVNALSKGRVPQVRGRSSSLKLVYRNKETFSFWLSIIVLTMFCFFGIVMLFSSGPLKEYSLVGIGSDIILFFQR